MLPILQPTYISTGILETMWIWNDYLLPYLVLDIKRYKTVPIAVQYLKGGYGSVDMGAMMATLVMAIIPIILFYLVSNKSHRQRRDGRRGEGLSGANDGSGVFRCMRRASVSEARRFVYNTDVYG